MRLNELEGRLDEIKAKTKIEEGKIRLKLSKPEIVKFINKAIRKEPAQLIHLLVKKIILYDDKIEIYYNTTERIRPDEDTHQVFCFYTEKFDYENRGWWYHVKGGDEYEIEVAMFI